MSWAAHDLEPYVVQKHLGSDSLQRWITEQDWCLRCTRLSSAKAFRILEVRRS